LTLACDDHHFTWRLASALWGTPGLGPPDHTLVGLRGLEPRGTPVTVAVVTQLGTQQLARRRRDLWVLGVSQLAPSRATM